MKTEDGQIIRRCLDGETEAFGFLVDKYRESVFVFAYAQLHNFEDAEDITQEVFLKAYKKLRTLRQWDSFVTWLHSITINCCKDLIKSQARQRKRISIKRQFSEEQTEILPEPDNPLFDSINEALGSLPEIYQQVLSLHYLGGMSSSEIAKALRMSPIAVRQRLNRARAELKEEVLEMVGKTFERHKLPAGFTFHIVEIVKHIRIQPLQPIKGFPWLLSLATGIIFGILSLGSGIKLPDIMPVPMSSSISSESKVLKIGEIPIDVLKTSEMTFISNYMGKGKGGNPEQFNAQSLLMSPQGQGDTWAKRTNMHISRIYLSTGVVNGKIYAIGGAHPDVNGVLGPVSTIEEYDPKTDKWKKKADTPSRWYSSASVLNKKIYVIGGEAKQGNDLVPVSTVEEYDPIKDIWTKKADMPTVRRGLSVCALNGKIYAIGGSPSMGGIPLQTVEEYDPATDKWAKKADMPNARNDLCTGAVNGKIYAIGGSNRNVGIFPIVEEYDPVTDTWTRKADMPTPRWGLSAAVVNGKIYAFGGCSPWAEFSSSVEEYGPSIDKWTKKADMPTARRGLSACAVYGKIYAIGGWNDQDLLSIVEEYDTGFEGEGLEASGKLPAKWGKIKRDN